MKISIIGSGNVGGTLGKLWGKLGHSVFYGTRNPAQSSVQSLVQEPNVQAGTYTEAVAFADLLILAVPWDAALDVVRQLGDLEGKVLVDTTNPLTPGLGGLAVGYTTSAAEEIAKVAPNAHVVKAFNMIGAASLSDPFFNGIPADMLICGNDISAKEQVRVLTQSLGFVVIDVGGLNQARYLEPLAMLWINLAFKQKMGMKIAFKVLAKE